MAEGGIVEGEGGGGHFVSVVIQVPTEKSATSITAVFLKSNQGERQGKKETFRGKD